MTLPELRARTKRFAVAIVQFHATLPRTETARILGSQLVRSGTAVGANYRAACRSRSRRDFIAKLGIVIEEADETCFWLELLDEAGLAQGGTSELRREADELTRIFVASRQTARRNGCEPRR